MGYQDVGGLADFPVGQLRSVAAGRRSLCVLRTDEGIFAMRPDCPHQGASLCRGTVGGTMLASPPRTYVFGREGHVVRCPWHGWEFDVVTGEALYDREGMRLRTFDVKVESGRVLVDV